MKNENTFKMVTTVTVISIFITLITGGYDFILPLYYSIKYKMDLNGASSIGIIGGADGPTSIILTGNPYFYYIRALFALISIIGISYIILSKKKKRIKKK